MKQIIKNKILLVFLVMAMVVGITQPQLISAKTKEDVALNKTKTVLSISEYADKTIYGKENIGISFAKKVSVKDIKYKSNDKNIVKVNKNGRLIAKNAGKTVVSITVNYTRNNKSFTKTFKQKVIVKQAETFLYKHNPLLQTKAMEDIVVSHGAIYGFAPNPDSERLGSYASADWSDPKIVEKGRNDRIAYHKSIESMYKMLDSMTKEGKSIEEIARAISTERNRIRLAAYENDPEGLAKLKESNLKTYGNENGGTPDYFYKKYGSWETVLVKSFSVNIGMDVCLGLYDDYYDSYVKLGLINE